MFSIFPFLLILIFPKETIFADESIEMIYPFRTRKIIYKDIDNFEIIEIINPKSNMHSYLLSLKLNSSDDELFLGFKEFSVSMYFTLKEKMKKFRVEK